MTMSELVTPPEGLSGQELMEWALEQNLRSKPRNVALPEMSGIDPGQAVKLGFLHVVFPPAMGEATHDYIRLYPYIWFACQYPERYIDEAMLLDDNCPRCKAEEGRRGLPVETEAIPPLASDAPRFRDPPA